MANGPYHQLVLMKHASIFINDAEETGRIFNLLPTKGPIYDIFRYNKAVPDILASDGEDWKVRSSVLTDALQVASLSQAELDLIFVNLNIKLNQYAESNESVSLFELLTYLSLDLVCQAFFKYPLEALKGSADGIKLFQCLETLTEYQSGQGIYANPKARKISEAELKQTSSDWRSVFNKLLTFMKSDAEAYQIKHGELNVKDTLGHAFIHLMEKNKEKYGEIEFFSDVHQIIRHGHECLAGTLCWAFYAQYKNKKVYKLVLVNLLFM